MATPDRQLEPQHAVDESLALRVTRQPGHGLRRFQVVAAIEGEPALLAPRREPGAVQPQRHLQVEVGLLELAQLDVGNRALFVVERIERVELNRAREIHDRFRVLEEAIACCGPCPERGSEHLVVQAVGFDPHRRLRNRPLGGLTPLRLQLRGEIGGRLQCTSALGLSTLGLSALDQQPQTQQHGKPATHVRVHVRGRPPSTGMMQPLE